VEITVGSNGQKVPTILAIAIAIALPLTNRQLRSHRAKSSAGVFFFSSFAQSVLENGTMQ
jgi:hypothetical protein